MPTLYEFLRRKPPVGLPRGGEGDVSATRTVAGTVLSLGPWPEPPQAALTVRLDGGAGYALSAAALLWIDGEPTLPDGLVGWYARARKPVRVRLEVDARGAVREAEFWGAEE